MQLVPFVLDFRLSGSRRFFLLDCASHVGSFLLFHTPAAKPPFHIRVAIWNRKAIAMGIAVTAWITNVAFLVHGKSLLQAFMYVFISHTNMSYVRYHTGE